MKYSTYIIIAAAVVILWCAAAAPRHRDAFETQYPAQMGSFDISAEMEKIKLMKKTELENYKTPIVAAKQEFETLYNTYNTQWSDYHTSLVKKRTDFSNQYARDRKYKIIIDRDVFKKQRITYSEYIAREFNNPIREFQQRYNEFNQRSNNIRSKYDTILNAISTRETYMKENLINPDVKLQWCGTEICYGSYAAAQW